jgi:hypothetical protein
MTSPQILLLFLLLILLMKQQNLHPQKKVLKTIMLKQVIWA